jgi:hypothetical protein
MRWRCLAVCALLMIPGVARAQASDEGSALAAPRRFSVNLAAGAHLNDGGNLQAVSFGFAPWRALSVFVNVERNHVPTRIRRYPEGFAATRGGTLTSVSGEVRYTVWQGERIAPFVLAGLGAGISQPNVNDIFTSRVTNNANVVYAGGGLIFPVGHGLALSVDAKFLLLAGREEIGAMVPIRAGVSWRF